MKIDLSKIYEGWRNQLFPPSHLKKIIESVARRRRNICNVCEHNSKLHSTFRPDIHCVICKCTLSAKTRCLSCDCPDSPPRWEAVLTEEEEEEIANETERIKAEENISEGLHKPPD